MATKYTSKEDEIIRKYYPTTPKKDMLKLLPDRTLPSIKTRAKRLRVLSEPITRIEITCIQCDNKTFLPPARVKKGAKFCSYECRVANWEAKRPKRNCKHCGQPLQVSPSRDSEGKGRYCNRECYEASLPDRIIKQCRRCGNDISLIPFNIRDGRGSYCSRKCQFENIVKNCELKSCGKEFKTIRAHLKKGAGKFCSRECFDISRKEKQVPVSCTSCKKNFSVIPYRYKSFNNASRNYGIFCSRECWKECLQNKHRVKRLCKLESCQKPFTIPLKESSKTLGSGSFCSMKCRKKYQGSSSLEIAIENVLNELGITYEKEKPFKHNKAVFYADFFLFHLDIILEVDGTQHDTDPKIKKKDKRRDKWFKDKGYTTIRIKEKDIRKDPQQALLEKLPSLQLSLQIFE